MRSLSVLGSWTCFYPMADSAQNGRSFGVWCLTESLSLGPKQHAMVAGKLRHMLQEQVGKNTVVHFYEQTINSTV